MVDEDLETPFSIMRLDFFKGSNFPWSVIDGAMSEGSRTTHHYLNAMFDEGPYCVFAKIEVGKHRLNNNKII